METVRDRVKAVLERTGWSQRELAKRASLAPSHVSLIVTRLGENVRPDTLRAIARAAGVSEVWLLTGLGSPDDAPGVAASPAATAAEHPTDPAPPPVPVVPATESPLERALGAAFDHTRHNVNDLRAVQDALNDGTFPWQTIELDLVEAARTWLDAAAQMRREGQTVTPVGMLFRVTLSNTPLAHELAAKRRAALEAARAAPPRPQSTQIEETGPSGVRVIGASGSADEPKTAKG